MCRLSQLMCNGRSADSTINSCNGFDCAAFLERSGQNGRVLVDHPGALTELWSPWYQQWSDGGSAQAAYDGGDAEHARKHVYIAARWFARGGSHLNWYMWHGGNNYVRGAGASTAPWYYVGAQLSPDGLRNEPFASHTAALYAALSVIAPELLAHPAQANAQQPVPFLPSAGAGAWVFTDQRYAFVYGGVAFIENAGRDVGTVRFRGREYASAPESILIVDGSGELLFDTSAVSGSDVPTRSWTPVDEKPFLWTAWSESQSAGRPGVISSSLTVGTCVEDVCPMEQLRLTQDDTEHALYTTRIDGAVVKRILDDAGSMETVPLVVTSARATALCASIVDAGNASISSCSCAYDVTEDAGPVALAIAVPTAELRRGLASSGGGTVLLSLASESLGVHKLSTITNGPAPHAFTTTAVKGISGSVLLGGVDITRNGWTSTSGLAGEVAPPVWTAAGSARVAWAPTQGVSPPATWLRTTFAAPQAVVDAAAITASLHLDASGLSRGHFYVNDWEVSRFWATRFCGEALCQRYYHVPPDVLVAGENNLTIYDAEGARNLDAVRMVLSRPDPRDVTAPKGISR